MYGPALIKKQMRKWVSFLSAISQCLTCVFQTAHLAPTTRRPDTCRLVRPSKVSEVLGHAGLKNGKMGCPSNGLVWSFHAQPYDTDDSDGWRLASYPADFAMRRNKLRVKQKNSLAEGNSVFQDVGKVQLIPQTFGRLRVRQLAVQHRLYPIQSFASTLQAKLGLTLQKSEEKQFYFLRNQIKLIQWHIHGSMVEGQGKAMEISPEQPSILFPFLVWDIDWHCRGRLCDATNLI